MEAMKISVLSNKLIKPSKPTPPHLSIYRISILDELNPAMYVLRLLYYPPNSIFNEKQINLEQSLAQVLPKFYPLAGRYVKEQHLVDCNDKGAEYKEAQANCRLVQLMESDREPEQLNQLLPLDICGADEPTDPMLSVQINKFLCGGIVIGVCASHRVFDSSSLGTFLAAWANETRGENNDVITPNFVSPVFFPGENHPPISYGVTRDHKPNIITKRFVFDKKAIQTLRNRGSFKPSRVVAVSAIVAAALLRADRAKHGKSRQAFLSHDINIRKRTVPPIPNESIGTWATSVHLELTADESGKLEFEDLALKLHGTIKQGIEDCTRILSDRDFGRRVMVDTNLDGAIKSSYDDVKVIWYTDWSKFGCYEIDFGWGKPIWVSIVDIPLEDHVILMNTKDNDGIEAWVFLHKSDMDYFVLDDEIKSLTTIKPRESDDVKYLVAKL